MEFQTTRQRVDKVLRAQLGEGFEWTDDTSLTDGFEKDGLSLDSLDLVELVMGLEDEFVIEIDEQELMQGTEVWNGWRLRGQYDRVRDLVDFIDSKLTAVPALKFA